MNVKNLSIAAAILVTIGSIELCTLLWLTVPSSNLLQTDVCDLSSLGMNVSAIHTPTNDDVAKLEDPSHPNDDLHVCMTEGIHGSINESALVSIIVTPKSLSEKTFNSGGELHLRHIMWSWKQLDRVNFVVMSPHCSVLRMARNMGLPTLKVSSGSDVGDLTYRHALKMVESSCRTPIVGFSNSDIAFDDSLTATLDALLRLRKKDPAWDKFMIVGQRKNVNVPKEMFQKDGAVTPEIWNNIVHYMHKNGALFQTDAQDFFLFTRPLGIDWVREIPEFIIGGVWFDNWFTSYIENRPGIREVDVTKTLYAMHINHGGSTHGSHMSVASSLNRRIGKDFGISGGHTNHASFFSDAANGTIVIKKR